MRTFMRFFTALALTILVPASAFAQIDSGANIQNLPPDLNLQELQNLEPTEGQHLLTLQVPVHARDLHEDIQRIKVVCKVWDDGTQTPFLASGATIVRYRGQTLRTTVSVPLEFREGEEDLVLVERYGCWTLLPSPDGEWVLPEADSSDPRFLLDESATSPPLVHESLDT